MFAYVVYFTGPRRRPATLTTSQNNFKMSLASNLFTKQNRRQAVLQAVSFRNTVNSRVNSGNLGNWVLWKPSKLECVLFSPQNFYSSFRMDVLTEITKLDRCGFTKGAGQVSIRKLL